MSSGSRVVNNEREEVEGIGLREWDEVLAGRNGDFNAEATENEEEGDSYPTPGVSASYEVTP